MLSQLRNFACASAVFDTASLQTSLYVPRQVLSGRMDQPRTEDAAPSGPNPAAAESSPQQLIDQLSQLLEVLQRAHGGPPGSDELAGQQRTDEQHAPPTLGSGQLQQEQRDKWVAQELLVHQLTQQLSAYAEALEQLHGICQQQQLRTTAAESHALGLQQQLVKKNKRVQELELESLYRQGKIQDLEARVVKYRRLCSYVTTNSQVHILIPSCMFFREHVNAPVCIHLQICARHMACTCSSRPTADCIPQKHYKCSVVYIGLVQT